jgi:hypothetical protein
MKIKTELVGSAPSKEQLAELIRKNFYWKEPADLHENIDGIFTVHYPASSPKAGKQLDNYIVKNKNGRFRFERIIG